MKMTKYTYALILLSLFGTTTYASAYETVTVTGSKWSEADVAHAKHQIALIQMDPGYYYSGASGAVHRVQDVNYFKKIVEQGDRYPASVK